MWALTLPPHSSDLLIYFLVTRVLLFFYLKCTTNATTSSYSTTKKSDWENLLLKPGIEKLWFPNSHKAKKLLKFILHNKTINSSLVSWSCKVLLNWTVYINVMPLKSTFYSLHNFYILFLLKTSIVAHT